MFLPSPLLCFALDRRTLLSSLPSTSLIANADTATVANRQDEKIPSYMKEEESESWMITLPLERSSGGTNNVRVTLSYEKQSMKSPLFGNKIFTPKKIFKLIVDTGSPYIVIADGTEYAKFIEEDISVGYTDQLPWFVSIWLDPILESMTLPENIPCLLQPSQYESTEEIYGSQKGDIIWNESYIQMRDDRLSGNMVIGVLDEKLRNEAGGSLLGLIKNSNSQSTKVQLRPTFLAQQDKNMGYASNNGITSFTVDSPQRKLILARNMNLIPEKQNAIPLVDLRSLGDFVEHYACQVDSFILNGKEYTSDIIHNFTKRNKRSIVAVFDSGLSGCLFTDDLWEDLQICDKDFAKSDEIKVGIVTENQDEKKWFQSSNGLNPFYYISKICLDWFDDEDTSPYLIIIGQTFLIQGSLTIDITERRALFVEE